MINPWFALSFKALQLGLDAQNVVALRMLRLAAGGSRMRTEASRMVSEKAQAIVEAQVVAAAAVMAGQKDHIIAGKTLKVFKKRLSANKRRLSRR